jgi:hypothetical protein
MLHVRCGMIYIIKTIQDQNGNQVGREALPVTFDGPAQATRFLDRYIAEITQKAGEASSPRAKAGGLVTPRHPPLSIGTR